MLNKKEETFLVYLSIPKVISYEEVTKLFECAKKGINGDKKCTINISYGKVTEEDVLNLSVDGETVTEEPKSEE